jgi:hypothetical protein
VLVEIGDTAPFFVVVRGAIQVLSPNRRGGDGHRHAQPRTIHRRSEHDDRPPLDRALAVDISKRRSGNLPAGDRNVKHTFATQL